MLHRIELLSHEVNGDQGPIIRESLGAKLGFIGASAAEFTSDASSRTRAVGFQLRLEWQPGKINNRQMLLYC